MPPRKNTKTKVRHNPGKWALQVFRSSGGDRALPTAEVLAKASALSGGKIPYYSIYQALRTLVRRKVITVRRQGRERVYRLAAPGTPAAAPPSTPSARAPPRPAPAPTPGAPVTPGLHVIAPGEIALIHIGDAHVESAANVDGKLVLKRHPRPA